MSVIKVSIKWGKNKYDDVELDTEQPGIVFKSQLYSLTKVPPERQKIMVKGGTLKDDANWNDLGIKNGQVLMMMGSADELQKPAQRTVFMEDLSNDDQKTLDEFGRPQGLTNLGNTCYMNATLQCMRAVPELQEAIKIFPERLKEGDNPNNVTASLRDLFTLLKISNQSIPPLIFLQVLRSAFPQFAQKGTSNEFMQQDAEECWTQIMISLSQKLPKIGSKENPTLTNSAITQLFSGEMTSTLKNTESEVEPVTTKVDRFEKLSCHIGNSTSFLIEGIKESLEENLTKNSTTLGREAIYKKSSKISTLPFYLTVQFVRFFWKQGVQLKAKIVKPVDFPFTLDLYDICNDDLKAKLAPGRKLHQENEEKRIEHSSKNQKDDGKEEVKSIAVQPMEITTDPSKLINETGMYELFAVLTHKGRAADGGHYIAWVKEENGENWLKYDDDKVSVVNSEEIRKLTGKGGGDWHMAYLTLYRTIRP